MKVFLKLLFISIPAFSISSGASTPVSHKGFTENKGQVANQYNQPRPDVLFTGNTGNFTYHLKTNGISYQLIKEEPELLSGKSTSDALSKTTIYRLDMEWPGINKDYKIRTDETLTGTSNYYTAVCPGGILNVKTYSGVFYKELYKNIDLHYYLLGDELKYDYLVGPHGDYKQIRIRIKGSESITLQPNGSAVIKTPLGCITEAAPIVLQDGKRIKSAWVITNGELSFRIDAYDPSRPLVIDPVVRSWGTYYGEQGTDESKACATDVAGNVYAAGRTNSTINIATNGSFKTTLSGSSFDAFLVKFNSAGIRLWATYYGGAGDDLAWACATDPSNNVYIGGEVGSLSTTGIATNGAQQLFSGGDTDAFLVKFDNSGARLWGTYYGGPGIDKIEGLAVDAATSEVYMSGYTAGASGTVIATSGAHQTTYGSAFLGKFNSTGLRQWCTYYGNSSYSHANACTVDPSGNVYMAGTTDATGGISTPAAHQVSLLGMMDGFLAKFTNAGVRIWATYYGDISLETMAAVTTDPSGNVYIGGSTGSPSGMATPGAHQQVIGMMYNPDGLLVKFNSAGVRQWGTYYGGDTEDYITSCFIAANGDLYMTGYSRATVAGVISTANGFQPANAGNGDAFLARFTTAGVRVAATYYGGPDEDVGYACAGDANNNIYLAGRVTGAAGDIANSGSQQDTYGGGALDAFLVQFGACVAPAAPVNVTPAFVTTLCAGGSTTLTATASGTVNWYNSQGSTTSLGTGSLFITPVLTAGTATYFAETSGNCGSSMLRTPVAVTVYALPATTITGNTKICAGKSTTLTASGAGQYTWNNGYNNAILTVTPNSTSSYTVTGISANGCSKTASVTITVSTCTGIEENESYFSVKLYPNPAREFVTIQSGNVVDVTLLNTLGQQLLQKKCESEITRIDLSDYAKGVYFIQLKQQNQVKRIKLVKD